MLKIFWSIIKFFYHVWWTLMFAKFMAKVMLIATSACIYTVKKLRKSRKQIHLTAVAS